MPETTERVVHVQDPKGEYTGYWRLVVLKTTDTVTLAERVAEPGFADVTAELGLERMTAEEFVREVGPVAPADGEG